MSANRFCVYEHWRTDTNTCFYVGKGTIKRSSQVSSKARNIYHTNIINKLVNTGHKHEVRLVRSGLLEKEAFELELERIKFWRSQGIKLANMADGGGGCSGYKQSPDAVAKISSTHRGKILSDETKAKISAAKKGVSPSIQTRIASSIANKGNKHALGKILSEESKAKISAATKGKPKGTHAMERKLKISESLKGNKCCVGRTLSEDSKLKMSASVKASWILRKAKLAEVSICE